MLKKRLLKININPSPKQAIAWRILFDDVTTEIGYGGGSRGGKSWYGVEALIFFAIRYPDTRYVIGRKELKTLKQTSLVTFFKVCQHHNLRQSVDFKYNEQMSTITFWNGSQIILMELAYKPTDPLYTTLGGLEITAALIEESNEVPVQAVDILKTRVGNWNNQRYNIKPFLIQTFNPDKGHVYIRFYKPWRDGKELPYRKFVRALVTDNPFANPAYIEELKRAPKITKERLLYGNFEYDEDPMALMEYDSIVDLFSNSVDQGEERYMTVDVARMGMDKTVFMCWKGFHCYRITTIPKCKLDDLVKEAERIRVQEQIPLSHCIADEDGVGGGVVDFWKCKGFVGGSSPIIDNTAEDDKLRTNYLNLRSQCYYMLADYVNNNKMAIRCDDEEVKEDIQEEMEVIKAKDADKDGKRKVISKDEIKEALGRSCDYSDTAMMRLWFEVQRQKVPQPGMRWLS